VTMPEEETKTKKKYVKGKKSFWYNSSPVYYI
jgi:hypothetical protein